MGNAKRGKVESCTRISSGNGWLTLKEDEVPRILNEYFEDLCIIDAQEQAAVYIYGFDGARRGNYFGGEPIMRTKFE